VHVRGRSEHAFEKKIHKKSEKIEKCPNFGLNKNTEDVKSDQDFPLRAEEGRRERVSQFYKIEKSLKKVSKSEFQKSPKITTFRSKA